jgi:hypothetical protein
MAKDVSPLVHYEKSNSEDGVWAACGAGWPKWHILFERMRVTVNKERVTCEKCKRTELYASAA